MTQYILTLLFSTDLKYVVLLKKLKGPSFLLGKWTFPGGKIEESDASLAFAASRECSEETGVFLSVAAWTHLHHTGGEHFELDAMVAVSEEAVLARQMEEEPIEVRLVSEVLAELESNREAFTPDFAMLFSKALACEALQP